MYGYHIHRWLLGARAETQAFCLQSIDRRPVFTMWFTITVDFFKGSDASPMGVIQALHTPLQVSRGFNLCTCLSDKFLYRHESVVTRSAASLVTP